MFIITRNTSILYSIVFSLIIPLIGAANKVYGQPILTINCDASPKIALSPDGKRLLTGRYTVKIWDVETGREILHYPNIENTVASSVFSPDGRHIFTGSTGYVGQYWDMIAGEKIYSIETFTNTKDPRTVMSIHGITACDFTPDGSQLITGDSNGEVQLWDTATGKEIRRYEPRGYVQYIKISPDGKTFLKQDFSQAFLIDMETGEIINDFLSAYCSISKDWKYMLSNMGQCLRIFDINTGDEIQMFPLLPNVTKALAISPDGKYSIIGGVADQQEKVIANRRIFNNETGSEIRSYTTSLEVEKNASNSVDSYLQFFPDGKRFLTVNGSNIHIWDISDLTSGVKSFDSLDQ